MKMNGTNSLTSLSSPTQPRPRKNESVTTTSASASITTSNSNQSFQSSSSKLLQVDVPSSSSSQPIALGDISAEMASELIDTRPNSSNSKESSSNESDESTSMPHSSTTFTGTGLSHSRGAEVHHPIFNNLSLRSVNDSSSPPSSSGIHDVFHTPTTLTPSNSQSMLATANTPRIGTHGHIIPPPRSESTMTDPSDLDDLSRSSTDRSYYPDDPTHEGLVGSRDGNVGMKAMDRELNSLTYENLNASFNKGTAPKLGGFGVRTEGMGVGEKAQKQQQNGFAFSGMLNGKASSSSNSTNSSSHSNLRTPPKPKRIAAASTPPVTPNPNEWASNFWCVITDPMSGQSFFANPETGECAWEVKAGTFVLPPNPEGQWWELLDEARNLPYFYHTTTKVSTWIRPEGFVIPLTAIQESTLGRRFSKLEFGKDSLSALAGSGGDEEVLATTDSELASSVPPTTSKRLSQPPAPSHSPSIEQVLAFENKGAGTNRGLKHQTMGSRDDLMASAMAGSRTRALGSSRLSGVANGAQSISLRKNTRIPVVQLEPPSSSPSKSKGSDSKDRTRSASSEQGTRPHPSRTQSSGNERRGHGGFHSSSDPSGDLASSEKSLDLSTLSSFEISAPIRRERDPAKRNGPMSLLRTRKVSTTSKSQKQKSSSSSSEPGVTRLSTGEHRVLPSPLADEIRKVNFSTYASRHFSPHRSAILRRKTPTHKLSSFQKTPISAPLLPLDKELHKDAVKIFKVILRICGDRDTPVHARLPAFKDGFGTVPDRNGSSSPIPSRGPPSTPRSPPTRKNSSGLGTPVGAGIQSFSTPTKNGSPYNQNQDDSFSQSQYPPTVLEEERWLLERGILGGPKLRDEIYVQVLKQLSENPRLESSFRCWQLLCVLLDTFPPTLTFHSYLRDFIEGHAHFNELSLEKLTQKEENGDRDAITAIARHCVGSLSRIQKRGARGKAPSLVEIECSSEKAFNPTVFGHSLEDVMEVQAKAYPDAQVPIIATFLTEALLGVGAEREGIFRIAGDTDAITELKVRIERGQYTLQDLSGFDAETADAETDVAILTSLLKLWLRELEEPLIPSDMYQDCLSAAKESPAKAIALVRELPTINKRVLLFIISFLQLFCPPEVVIKTRMPVDNISLVWAPNVLRCESDDLTIAYPNSRLEQAFVKQLLLYLDCQTLDEGYRPPHHVEKSGLFEAVKAENEKNNSKNGSSTPSGNGIAPSKPLPHLYGRALSPITDQDSESVTTDSTAPGRESVVGFL